MNREPDTEERAVIAAYLDDPEAGIRRQRAIALRYAIGAGLFMIAAFWFDTVWLALPVYGVFLVWLVLRHRAFSRRTRVLARVIQRYEDEGR
jgi:Flp pilus assembly protein TadB